MVICSGMFNKKVSFVKIKVLVNSFGGRGKVIKEKLFDEFVYLSNLRNAEFFDNYRSKSKTKLRLRVRFSKKLLLLDSDSCFVDVDGKFFNILSMENVLCRNREILMYLEAKDE